MNIVELKRELRKAGVPVYREIKNKGSRVGTANSSRYLPSLTQKAGIELREKADGSGYSIWYNKGWKNDAIHNTEQIGLFINKAVQILEFNNVGQITIKENR